MGTKSKRSNEPDGTLSSLNAAVNFLDLARDTTSVKPARDTFRAASLLLTTIRVRFLPGFFWLIIDWCTQDETIEEARCVELGLTCAEICRALDRGTNGRQQETLGSSILEAIERLKR